MNKTRQKIYHIPGIITLIILPIVFIYYSSNEIKSRKNTVLQIVLADTTLLKKYSDFFKSFRGSFPPKRNYRNIDLSGNIEIDKIKLDYSQLQVREILSQKDSVNGVHFNFKDSSHYGSFIKSLSILKIEGAKTYMLVDNDLWFYHFQPDTTISLMPYSCLLCDDVITIQPKVPWFTKANQWIKHILRNAWEIITVSFLFALSVLILKRHNIDK